MAPKQIITLGFLALFCLAASNTGTDDEIKWLSRNEATSDLEFFRYKLESLSSYQGLNGYDWLSPLGDYELELPDSVTREEVGIFMAKLLANIGDRHASIRGYRLPNKQFLPFIVAPYDGKVLALKFEESNSTYSLLFPNYPYLKIIDHMNVEDMMDKVCFSGKLAPKDARLTRGVKELKYIERNYSILNKSMPSELEFIFSNGTSDTIVHFKAEGVRSRYITWDEKFSRQNLRTKDLLDVEKIQHQFALLTGNIAYIRIPQMYDPEEGQLYYEALRNNMQKFKSTDAMIIDIRSNGGGTRHLIWDLAGYLVKANSIHVVNLARQRSRSRLKADQIDDLHHRFLYAYTELETPEQTAVDSFMKSFKPQYNLPDEKYTPYYYAIFNGQKLKKSHHYSYDKPVYILTNERTFSAASVMAACFKGIPNIRLAGVTTDGSSGNSERFELSRSGMTCKISTMVSFQKDGRILDGNGTQPDIKLERNLKQVFWLEDSQLQSLVNLISASDH